MFPLLGVLERLLRQLGPLTSEIGDWSLSRLGYCLALKLINVEGAEFICNLDLAALSQMYLAGFGHHYEASKPRLLLISGLVHLEIGVAEASNNHEDVL